MRDLKIQADLARPPAPTLQQNLETLYSQGHCPDFTLVYQVIINNLFIINKQNQYNVLASCKKDN